MQGDRFRRAEEVKLLLKKRGEEAEAEALSEAPADDDEGGAAKAGEDAGTERGEYEQPEKGSRDFGETADSGLSGGTGRVDGILTASAAETCPCRARLRWRR